MKGRGREREREDVNGNEGDGDGDGDGKKNKKIEECESKFVRKRERAREERERSPNLSEVRFHTTSFITRHTENPGTPNFKLLQWHPQTTPTLLWCRLFLSEHILSRVTE